MPEEPVEKNEAREPWTPEVMLEYICSELRAIADRVKDLNLQVWTAINEEGHDGKEIASLAGGFEDVAYSFVMSMNGWRTDVQLPQSVYVACMQAAELVRAGIQFEAQCNRLLVETAAHQNDFGKPAQIMSTYAAQFRIAVMAL